MRSGFGFFFLTGSSAWLLALQSLTVLHSIPSAFTAEVATPAEERSDLIDKYMSSMTLEQKINQMAQIDISLIFNAQGLDQDKIDYYFGKKGFGSLLIVATYAEASYLRGMMGQIRSATEKYNMPPVIAGLDSVHGANYIRRAIMFPQQLNIAATFDPMNAKYAGKIAARDTLAGGINWVYSPILGLGIEPQWARMYETFGEDPHVVGKFGTKLVEGIQENKQSAACAKHFVGYSDPRSGHDRAPSWIPTRHLYQYFVRPWRDVIDNAKPLTVMESYSEYDGVANVANRNSLRTLLREELGFDGVLVTDYMEVGNLYKFHHNAADFTDAINMTLSEGSVDIAMLPFKTHDWTQDTETNLDVTSARKIILESRINRSVRRILELKQKLGMFDESDESSSNLDKIGDIEVRKAALKMASESIVLAKNDDDSALPITPSNNGAKVKVHITGPTSDSLTYQSGGWTIEWHGARSDDQFSYGHTVLQAAENKTDWDVTSSCGVQINGDSCNEMNATVVKEQRAAADYIVVGVGEAAYSEKMGDLRSLALPQGQRDFVHTLRKENPNAKIILVYFGGRPRLLGNMVEDSDAVLIAFLPGPDAGQAVVDLVSGDENFSAKLPITYPRYEDKSGVPYWHAVSDLIVPWDVEFKFGHGLSYTKFLYGNFQQDSKQVVYALPWSNSTAPDGGTVTFSVDVENTGSRTGMETVMFFIFVDSRHTTPEYKRLVHFEKVELQPSEKKTVSFDLGPKDLQYVGPHDDKHDILQVNEKFRIAVGPYAVCRDLEQEICSDDVTLKMSDDEIYDPACERACTLLDEKSCLVIHGVSSKECYDTCLSSPSSVSTDLNGWGWNYVNCIESILLDDRRSDETKCTNVGSLCRNVFPTIDTNKTRSKLSSWYEMLKSYLGQISPDLVVVFCTVGITSAFLYLLYAHGCLGRGGRDPSGVEKQGENAPLLEVI